MSNECCFSYLVYYDIGMYCNIVINNTPHTIIFMHVLSRMFRLRQLSYYY